MTIHPQHRRPAVCPRDPLMVEAILYHMPVGCPWRDLPVEFGCWNSIYQPFNRWSLKDKWLKIFKNLVQEPDLEWAFIDGSIVRAHQHSAGAIGKENQAIGKSVVGFTQRYNVNQLVYYEVHQTIMEAAQCEK